MNLTPREKDKLMVAMAAMIARKRLERGVKLNHPEAIALIGYDIGVPLIPEMIHEVQVEATFPDGTKLVTVHNPIR